MALLTPMNLPKWGNIKRFIFDIKRKVPHLGDLGGTLKASTLFETLLSMIIIMMCFGISLSIYLNVMESNNNMQKLNVHLLLNQLVMEAKEKSNYTDEHIETESLIIEKTVLAYPQSEKLSVLTYSASDKNARLIAKHRELVIVP